MWFMVVILCPFCVCMMLFTMNLFHCGFLIHFCPLLCCLLFSILSSCFTLFSHFLSLWARPSPSTFFRSPSVSPSSHEFIMWRKIEQWLFVPVPVCHWSRMNNSVMVVEVGISKKRGNYFGAASFKLFLKRRTVASFLPRTPRLLSLFPPARPSHQFTT